MDPSDRETSGEADAEATPAMGTSTSMDPSDRKTSGEADAEATPAMGTSTGKVSDPESLSFYVGFDTPG